MTRKEILSIAKQILFNTDMVRAILDDRKTVTRRVIKPQPEKDADLITDNLLPETKEAGAGAVYLFSDATVTSPRYEVGDYLYVRETWNEWTGGYLYKAWPEGIHQPGKSPEMGWRPSIHMPKEAARVFLKVTDIRAERLQELSVNELREEGIDCSGFLGEHPTMTAKELFSKFEELWDSTISQKDLDKYSWHVNPWVWVIEFERVEVEG